MRDSGIRDPLEVIMQSQHEPAIENGLTAKNQGDGWHKDLPPMAPLKFMGSVSGFTPLQPSPELLPILFIQNIKSSNSDLPPDNERDLDDDRPDIDEDKARLEAPFRRLGNRYQCVFCNYTCKTSTTIRLHTRRVHFNERLFPCQFCSYSAKQKSALDLHVRGVHEELRLFQCDMCPFSSAYKCALQKHMKNIHERLREARCPHCPYCTNDKSNLKLHIKRVHLQIKPESKFSCEFCNYTSSRPIRLKQHKASRHNHAEYEFLSDTGDSVLDTEHKTTHHLNENLKDDDALTDTAEHPEENEVRSRVFSKDYECTNVKKEPGSLSDNEEDNFEAVNDFNQDYDDSFVKVENPSL